MSPGVAEGASYKVGTEVVAGETTVDQAAGRECGETMSGLFGSVVPQEPEKKETKREKKDRERRTKRIQKFNLEFSANRGTRFFPENGPEMWPKSGPDLIVDAIRDVMRKAVKSKMFIWAHLKAYVNYAKVCQAVIRARCLRKKRDVAICVASWHRREQHMRKQLHTQVQDLQNRKRHGKPIGNDLKRAVETYTKRCFISPEAKYEASIAVYNQQREKFKREVHDWVSRHGRTEKALRQSRNCLKRDVCLYMEMQCKEKMVTAVRSLEKCQKELAELLTHHPIAEFDAKNMSLERLERSAKLLSTVNTSDAAKTKLEESARIVNELSSLARASAAIRDPTRAARPLSVSASHSSLSPHAQVPAVPLSPGMPLSPVMERVPLSPACTEPAPSTSYSPFSSPKLDRGCIPRTPDPTRARTPADGARRFESIKSMPQSRRQIRATRGPTGDKLQLNPGQCLPPGGHAFIVGSPLMGVRSLLMGASTRPDADHQPSVSGPNPSWEQRAVEISAEDSPQPGGRVARLPRSRGDTDRRRQGKVPQAEPAPEGLADLDQLMDKLKALGSTPNATPHTSPTFNG